MMKKLQKIIRVRMNISKRSDVKIIQDLEKKRKELKNDLKVYYEICEIFEKRAFENVISSSNHVLIFNAKLKCGRIIY